MLILDMGGVHNLIHNPFSEMALTFLTYAC